VKNSTLMLAAVHDGENDDGAISAALDALRTDNGLTLLAAVLEVARVHKAHTDAKEMATAAEMVRSGSALRKPLHRLIVAECPGAEEDGNCTVMLVEGDRWPYLVGCRHDLPLTSYRRQHIAVGAGWIVQRGETIRATLARTHQVLRRGKSK